MPPPAVPGAVPVSFDDAVADRLVAELEQLARVLCGAALESADAAVGARQDWQGFTRTWFEAEHGALLSDLRAAAREAWRTADLVRQAKAEAVAVQVERNDEAALARQAELRRLEGLVVADVSTAP